MAAITHQIGTIEASVQDKTHPADRYRGGRQYVERWTNAKVAFITQLTCRGYSAGAIAEVLNDGTTDATVRSMWAKWKIKPKGDVSLTIDLTVRERANISARAEQYGMPIEDYVKESVLAVAAQKDRLKQLAVSG